LADTEYATLPGPFPPLTSVAIHGALAVALQVHPAGVVTVTFPVPPADSNVRLLGEIAIEHVAVGSFGDRTPSQLAFPTETAARTTIALRRLSRTPHLSSPSRPATRAPRGGMRVVSKVNTSSVDPIWPMTCITHTDHR
jgi:hypothetical protein